LYGINVTRRRAILDYPRAEFWYYRRRENDWR
jgi:hypothetical protein